MGPARSTAAGCRLVVVQVACEAIAEGALGETREIQIFGRRDLFARMLNQTLLSQTPANETDGENGPLSLEYTLGMMRSREKRWMKREKGKILVHVAFRADGESSSFGAMDLIAGVALAVGAPAPAGAR